MSHDRALSVISMLSFMNTYEQRTVNIKINLIFIYTYSTFIRQTGRLLYLIARDVNMGSTKLICNPNPHFFKQGLNRLVLIVSGLNSNPFILIHTTIIQYLIMFFTKKT